MKQEIRLQLLPKCEAELLEQGKCPECLNMIELELENPEDGEQVWECTNCGFLAIKVENAHETE